MKQIVHKYNRWWDTSYPPSANMGNHHRYILCTGHPPTPHQRHVYRWPDVTCQKCSAIGCGDSIAPPVLKG